jgi:hypothetical protein
MEERDKYFFDHERVSPTNNRRFITCRLVELESFHYYYHKN